MQFTAQSQLTTCPQCDNVVRIDAESCNICGKRLRPPVSGPRHGSTPLTTQTTASNSSQAEEEEYEEEDEEYVDEDEEEDEDTPAPVTKHTTSQSVPPVPPAPGAILSQLHRLQDQSEQMERFFPADLPGKAQKLAAWKKQLERAIACVELFERPQLLQTESDQPLKLRQHVAEAAHALDYIREYTVKLIGHAGAGKSTLLAALIGQDIFPRLAGGAVTGVCTRVRLCHNQEPEEMRVHFLTRSAFDALFKQTQKSMKEAINQPTREALASELARRGWSKAGPTLFWPASTRRNSAPFVPAL